MRDFEHIHQTDTKASLLDQMMAFPEARNFQAAWDIAGQMVNGHRQHTVQPWQGALLYYCARQYNSPSATILELGTLVGHSAALLALAAPLAHIITVDRAVTNCYAARENLKKIGVENVHHMHMTSQEYLLHAPRPLSMVFHDADHYAGIYEDAAYYELLEPDGLFLFHDWTAHKYPDVIAVVEALGGPSFSFIGTEDNGHGRHGMAGIYKGVADVVAEL